MIFVPVFVFQEISLLSQFEHENIVQYLGTDKVFFLLPKLVSTVSLAALTSVNVNWANKI